VDGVILGALCGRWVEWQMVLELDVMLLEELVFYVESHFVALLTISWLIYVGSDDQVFTPSFGVVRRHHCCLGVVPLN